MLFIMFIVFFMFATSQCERPFDYARDITSDTYMCVLYVLSSVFTCLVFLVVGDMSP